jgi:hypothetical protein
MYKNVDASVSYVIELLEQIRNNEFVIKSGEFGEDLSKIIDRLNDDSFRMVVVGEFSSGKSSFLNALIGKDLLKHGVEETTATVTEIYNDISCADDDVRLDVYYSDGTVEKNIASDEIGNFTATTSTTHKVSSEIERVVIRSKILDTPAKVCFVDTPGLNGIADKHREKTIEQIKNAHLCIYIMQIRGLGQSDIDFLKFICRYQHNIIFVQNFIDELKEIEGESPEEKIDEQDKIIQEKIISENTSVKYEILPVSAKKALMARDRNCIKYNDEELTDELRNKIYDESRMAGIIKAIDGLMCENELIKIQKRDTIVIAKKLLEQLLEVVSFESEREIEEWEKSSDGVRINNYKKLLELYKSKKADNLKRLINFVESQAEDIRKNIKIDIGKRIELLEEDNKEHLNNYKEIDSLEKYREKEMSAELYSGISKIDDNEKEYMYRQFENVISDALLRIKEYTGEGLGSINVPKFEIKNQKAKINGFELENSQIKIFERQIDEGKKEVIKYSSEIKSVENAMIENDKEIKKLKDEKQKNEKIKDKELRNLGSMPDVEHKEKEQSVDEYRGGLRILDKLFGPKKTVKLVPYEDASKQDAWREKKRKIEEDYRIKEMELTQKICSCEDKQRQYEDKKYDSENRKKKVKKDIISIEEKLEAKLEYLKTAREFAKKECMVELKKEISGDVWQYLYEDVKPTMLDNFDDTVRESKNDVHKIVNDLYEMSYNEKINSLEKNIRGNAAVFSDNNRLIAMIKNTLKVMEDNLCRQ